MGLACPVCEVPHPDGEHLADHVAVTAATREGDHRAWLDEHTSDWGELTRTELAGLVTDHAQDVESVDLHEELGGHHHDQGHHDLGHHERDHHGHGHHHDGDHHDRDPHHGREHARVLAEGTTPPLENWTRRLARCWQKPGS